VDVFLLDDGFQHGRLKRDLDIVALDAARPFANGHLLPAGPLRESPRALRRADVLFLTRIDEASRPDLEASRRAVSALNAAALIVEARHAPVGLFDAASGQSRGLAFLEGRAVGVFCGIARPDSFVKTLTGLGARVVTHRFFGDHHSFTAAEIAGVLGDATAAGAEAIVTTQKDAERLGPASRRGILVLRVALVVECGEEELHDRLIRVCAR
jgi:tetraacyldisaccharide 4'-kinase